jgi:hypothetical protein
VRYAYCWPATVDSRRRDTQDFPTVSVEPFDMLVICNGMVRSGSTAQYNMARLLVERAGIGVGQGALAALFQGRSPDAGGLAGDSRHFAFKIHDLHEFSDPAYVVRLASEGRLKLLYIHRDIRDVYLSLKRMQRKSPEQLLAILDNAVQSWKWVEERLDEPWILVQRYDDLMADMVTATREIAHHLGVAATTGEIEGVAASCSLSSAEAKTRALKREVAREAIAERATTDTRDPTTVYWDMHTLLHHNHISRTKGRSGMWREELTDVEVDAVVDRYGSVMADLGYA